MFCSFGGAAAAEENPPEQETSPDASISRLSISSNPGAINQTTGTGQLGESLGLKNRGIFLGGVWVGDTNYLISGGQDPQTWSFNSLLIASLGVDAEKLMGWKGGKFGIEFLQFDGQPSNQQAAACRVTIPCQARSHSTVLSFIDYGGGRNSLIES